jgi:hypothetical protein
MSSLEIENEPLDEIRRVDTATEFLAAVEAGEVVTFEIEPGEVLRSDMPGPPEWLTARLKKLRDEEAFGAQEGHVSEGDAPELT